MNEVQIPDSAIGRVGLVALLRRVRPEGLGRLVALRHPVGMVSTLADSPRQVFAWQALVLGAPIEVNGKAQPEIVVADRCLVPVSQLTAAQVERLRKAQAMRDFHSAVEELRKVLNGQEVPPDMIERMLARAAERAAFRLALEVAPVATALRDIGFRPLHEGSSVWQWSCVHLGVELAVTAGPLAPGQWQLAGRCMTKDQRMWDEHMLPVEAPRGATVLAVLRLWRQAFGSAPWPGCLDTGALYERHRRDIDRLQLGRPILWVDGEALRAVRRRLVAAFGPPPNEVGPPPDMALALSLRDGMLRLAVDDWAFGCPAHGVWVDDYTVSLRGFLSVPTGYLRGQWVKFERAFDSLSVRQFRLLALDLSWAARDTIGPSKPAS